VKEERPTQVRETSGRIFNHARGYLRLAKFFQDEYPGNPNDCAIAVITNYALSVELMLKSLDATVTLSTVSPDGLLSSAEIRSSLTGHLLHDELFKNLRKETQTSLEKKFRDESGGELSELLKECQKYFVDTRYYYEPEKLQSLGYSTITQLALTLEKIIPTLD